MKDGELFLDWLSRAALCDDADRRIDMVRELKEACKESGTPVIEGTKVAFLCFSNAERVSLLGDMTDWVDLADLRRLPGTELFYLVGEYEAEARLQYWFVEDGDPEHPLLDRYNPERGYSGLGPVSVVTLPRFEENPLFREAGNHRTASPEESLREVILQSRYLGYAHTLHLWLPPDYKESLQGYPVVYFQDGLDYIRYAHAPFLLKALIEQKRIPPCIGVFVTPPNLHQPAEPNRSTEYGLNPDYIDFFCREVVPFTDKTCNTLRNPEDRIVVGDSYGGLISTAIAFRNPDIFTGVCSQSGYMSFREDTLIREIDESEKRGVRIYLHVGTYEKRVGAAFIPPGEQDFLSANRRTREVLEKKGYPHRYPESVEGHNWGNWGGHLPEALEYLFDGSRP